MLGLRKRKSKTEACEPEGGKRTAPTVLERFELGAVRREKFTELMENFGGKWEFVVDGESLLAAHFQF